MAASLPCSRVLSMRKVIYVYTRLFCSNTNGKDVLGNIQDLRSKETDNISHTNHKTESLENASSGDEKSSSSHHLSSATVDVMDQKYDDVPKNVNKSALESALSGLARVIEKYEKRDDASVEEEYIKETDSFATMLRKSKLMQIGDPNGRVVRGRIRTVVGDDLYIDFGGKFQCVCPRPSYQPERYHQGIIVNLKLKDLEMTSKFLGSEKHVTILEADATLIGLYRSGALAGIGDKHQDNIELS